MNNSTLALSTGLYFFIFGLMVGVLEGATLFVIASFLTGGILTVVGLISDIMDERRLKENGK